MSGLLVVTGWYRDIRGGCGWGGGGEAGGFDRCPVGGVGAVAASGQEGGSPAEVDETAAHRWDPVADPDGDAVAGRPGLLWSVADGLRAVPTVAASWGVGLDPGIVAGLRRRGGPHPVAGERGFDHRASPPARRRRPPRRAAAARAARWGRPGTRRPRFGSFPRRVDHQDTPGVRAGPQTLSIVITAGQRGDSPQFTAVLDGIAVARLGAGRPRTRPDAVLAARPTVRRPTAPTCADAGSKPRSRSNRPSGPPQEERLGRRAAAGLRRRALQTTPRRRVRHQRAQTEPGRGNTIR